MGWDTSRGLEMERDAEGSNEKVPNIEGFPYRRVLAPDIEGP